MNTNSVILMRSMIRLLVQYLELAGKIDDNDFKDIAMKARDKQKFIKGICDNATRGNIFMTVFFVREWLESISTD